MSTKRWMSWLVVGAMTLGGAGLALGGAALGAHAADRDETPPASIVPVAVPVAPTPTPAPAIARESMPAPTPVRPAGSFSIRRMQVTSEIDHREPIDHPSSFEDGVERIYAFVDASNTTDEARTLTVTFENGQRSTGHVTLEVPAHSPRFRTWAWTRLTRSPGEWTSIVRDESGAVIARDEFEIR
jgi:hypothetical protein